MFRDELSARIGGCGDLTRALPAQLGRIYALPRTLGPMGFWVSVRATVISSALPTNALGSV